MPNTTQDKEFPISDINGEQIGSTFLNDKGEITKETFLFGIKKLDGTIINPEAEKFYIEFVDQDDAIRFSPEPQEDPKLKPNTETTKKAKAVETKRVVESEEDITENEADKIRLTEIRDRIPSNNPFKHTMINLLNEVISKM